MRENEIKLINQLDTEIDELEEQIKKAREENLLLKYSNSKKEECLQQLATSNQSGYTVVGLLGLMAFIVSIGIIVLGVMFR